VRLKTLAVLLLGSTAAACAGGQVRDNGAGNDGGSADGGPFQTQDAAADTDAAGQALDWPFELGGTPSRWQPGGVFDPPAASGAADTTPFLLLNTGGTGGMFGQGDLRGDLRDVAFWKDGRYGVACSHMGVFYSEDGGLSWRRVRKSGRDEYPDDEQTVQYLHCELAGPRELWVAETAHPAIGRRLWHSTDAGATWQDVTARLPAQPESIWGLLARGRHVWLIGGWRPQASFQSADGGKTWKSFDIPEGFEPFRLATPASEPIDQLQTVYLLGAIRDAEGRRIPRLLRSDDAGATWRDVALPSLNDLPWEWYFSRATIAFATADEGVLGLQAGGLVFVSHGVWEKDPAATAAVLRTTDGGSSWTTHALPNEELLITALWHNPHDPRHLFAAVWNGFIAQNGAPRQGPALYESRDGGGSWAVALKGAIQLNALFGTGPGALWGVGDQVGFAANDVVAIAGGEADRWLGSEATAGPVPIDYTLAQEGNVTLVIETPEGKRVRNLIGDRRRSAGANTDYWDGRDDEGRVVAPGSYRVRGLTHQGLDARYEFAFGSPSSPAWTTSDGDGNGGWLSNHTNHLAVLADEDRVYVSAPESEGPYPLIALDYDGNKVWGGLSRWYAGYMARYGASLYVLNEKDARPASDPAQLTEPQPAGIELIRIDPATGREQPFSDGENRHTIATWRIDQLGVAKQWEGSTVQHHAHDVDWTGHNAAGLAAIDGSLYVSLHLEGKLLVVDATSGTVSGEIALDAPAGLAAAGDRLLAISDRQIVSIDPDSASIEAIVTSELQAPVDLAVDSQGNIYVSDWGDQMCVKVFSPAGRYIKTIGKTGGRPWRGAYDADAMLLPRGIAIDALDRLWVAEYDASPRRVSCWDTQTGELLFERLGRGRYGGMGYYVLPADPRFAVYMNNLVELDWEAGRLARAEHPLARHARTRGARLRPLHPLWRSDRAQWAAAARAQQHAPARRACRDQRAGGERRGPTPGGGRPGDAGPASRLAALPGRLRAHTADCLASVDRPGLRRRRERGRACVLQRPPGRGMEAGQQQHRTDLDSRARAGRRK
jgi:hypothetical protein